MATVGVKGLTSFDETNELHGYIELNCGRFLRVSMQALNCSQQTYSIA